MRCGAILLVVAVVALSTGCSQGGSPSASPSSAHPSPSEPRGAGVKVFTVSGANMDPTLKAGDRVLVDELAYRTSEPRRGDIIVFENPHGSQVKEDFISRVVGLPGDTVECRGGSVYLDGERLAEPYLEASIAAHGRDTRPCGPFHVPADDVFVMGDNRPDSNDSRYGLGYIPILRIVGRVVRVCESGAC